MTLDIEAAKKLWTTTRCRDLIRDHPIIEIEASTPITVACEKLVKHGISSAPVYNSKTNTYVGMLDYRDIVDYVLIVFNKKKLPPIQEDEVWGILEIMEKVDTGEPLSAQSVSDLSRRNPFYSVLMDSTLMDVAVIFGQSNGIHRVNVVDESGRVQGIISQSDLGRYILSKKSELSENLGKTIGQLGIGSKTVVAIDVDSSVLDALEKMSKYKVSSIAVIEAGFIFGNISMADIRFIFQNNRYDRLWMNCSRFVSLTLTQKGIENAGKDRFPVFTATYDLLLNWALEKILATRTHRLWIVDNHDKLIGVMSLTDIIQVFCPPNDQEK